jgi:hypothetical protein
MSRGHKIVANFLKARGAWDNKPTTVSSYVGKDAVKPAEKKPKLDAKVLNSYVGKKMAEAAVKMRQPGYNPPKQEHISSAEDQPDGEMTALMLGGKKSLGKIKEAAAAPPFDKPYKKVVGTVTDKSGAKHGPMSRARDLARKGMKQMIKINPKIAEGWSNTILDQLDEVHPAVMAMAKVGAKKDLKAKADQHTELAVAANRAGDDEKVRYHQAQVAKIKAQMQAEAKDPADWTRDEMEKMNADWRKSKGLKPVQPTRPPQKGMGAGKLPMTQAAHALAAEAVTYTGMGTDVVDKKKKLNPQPNLIMKPKQVKDFKEENLDELKASTLQSYADKAHQQALDATYDAAHLNRSGEEKLKADAKKLAAKRAGGVQRAQTKMDKMSEEMTDQAPMQLAHGIGDVVQCKRTQRLASIISAEDDKYTVVYADGSTETGPADYWSAIRPVTEGRIIEQPRGWNVKHLKPAGHGIVGKKVRSYDFPGMHDSHYIEGHVTDEDPNSYHIRTTKVVRHHKEEPIANHHMHIRAPKGISLFGGAQGVYYAPKEMKPAAKKTLGSLRGKK